MLPIAFMDPTPSTAESSGKSAGRDSDFLRALEAEKLEAMAEFAAGAGHEINNPLTVIAGRAQLLLRDERDPERRRDLALIVAQAMRVHEMIADMMLFARPPRPEFQRVDAAKLVDDLVAELLPTAAAQETELRRMGDPGPAFVRADPAQLAVVLRALCRNAFEALRRGGRVDLELKGSGVFLSEAENQGPGVLLSEVRILVRDNGPGLKPEERRHAFDPFYSARQAGRGLGLGLSKAWRIAANHGGRIDVESDPGRGTTFAVVLKRKK